MRLNKRILLAFSKEPEVDVEQQIPAPDCIESDLSLLIRMYPDFLESVRGKIILDFGCGFGYQTIALAKAGAKKVVGLDTNNESLSVARKLLADSKTENNAEFVSAITDSTESSFDIVISQNSMEHFPNPFSTINEMKAAIKPEGVLLISFGPPWFAPYGSHMQYFTKIPWVNILFSEETVMEVRSQYRTDGAKKYVEVESGLNKMTVARFEKLVEASGLQIDYKRYECVKGINILGSIPVIRELFINHITCRLIPKRHD